MKKSTENGSGLSPNRKRAKTEDTKKHKRTSYFFKPVNGLNGRPNNQKSIDHKSIDNKLEDDTPVENSQSKEETSINQSSDDSFETIGIKWRASPKNHRTTPQKPKQHFSSSPLKNITGNEIPSTINEQAESMLEKYGSGFHNISSKVTRSNSDLSNSILQPSSQASNVARPTSLQRVPSLQRAKSLGSKTSQSSNRLKKWIDKLDLNFVASDSPSKSPKGVGVPKGVAMPTAVKIEKEGSKMELESLEMSSKVLNNEPEAFVQKIELKPKESTPPSSPNLKSDPFSDDDDFIASFKPKNEFKLPPIPPPSKIITNQDGIEVEQGAELDEFDEFDISSTMENVHIHTEYSNDIKELTTNFTNEFESVPTTKLSYSRPDLKRLIIVDIFKTSYKIKNNVRDQLIVTVKDDNKESKLVLRGEYITLNFKKDDIVNLVITDPDCPHLVDDNKNILIWNPDIMISATTVAEQMKCPRKSVLKDRFSFPGDTSLPLLTGIILHEIFQSCFDSDWSIDRMQKLSQELVSSYILSFYSLGEGKDQEGLTMINDTLPYLKEWFDKYYIQENKTRVPPSRISIIGSREQVYFSITKALDIEENIWSPIFGIKGKVDVSIESKIKGDNRDGSYLLPLEFKTGREYISHHAQSSLYSLLFKDRYNLDVSSFLLVYTKEKITKLGNIRTADLRSLINLRNRISEYLVEGVRTLPEVLSSGCDRCEVQQECSTLNQLMSSNSQQTSQYQNSQAFSSLSGTQTVDISSNANYKEFYMYWDLLITKEEQLLKSLKKELWIMTSKERELKNGKALANLVIANINLIEGQTFKYIYTLKRSGKSELTNSFQTGQIGTHDRIMVSDENGHFALAGGFVTRIRPDEITIEVDRRISESQTVSQPQTETYRIDKDEMFHGMGLARYNLLNLFLPEGDLIRRRQIIDLTPPKFDSIVLKNLDLKFNSDQMAAFDKIVSAQDYSLILGMPGTGKTTLIACVINYLVSQNKTVLLASYTHSAVDNILIKLKQYNIDMLRVGHPNRVHTEILPFVATKEKMKTYEDFHNLIMTPKVVGVTCLGINDYIFNLRQEFDYCIIDEASQVSLPVSLGPLRFCKKYVLVGDHHQLPPLVQHSHPKVKKGLQTSLFQYLNDKFPESVCELSYQYRMCEDIMKLSNVLVYENRLKCGNQEIANQTLKFTNPNGYKALISGERDTWMKWLMNENNRVIFLDHDLVPGIEVSKGERVENPTEVSLIYQIVEGLLLNGVSQSDIGIMSLYRAQLKLLKKQFLHRTELECMTADQFQGRDKQCVIISLVRSNKEGKVGDLLQEWRRINVAVTRAKSKLIILGSKSTLSNSPAFKPFIDLIMGQKWMFRLPPNALRYYKQYEPEQSQTQSQSRVSKRTQSQLQSQPPNQTAGQAPNQPLGTGKKRSPITSYKVNPSIIGKSQVIKDIINEST